MADTSTPTTPPPLPADHATATTRRGIATASVSLGMWGLLVFWWYPFGMLIATVGFTLGLISVLLGIRAGKDGEHLAWIGLGLGFVGLNFAIAGYRFMQVAFEGAPTVPASLTELGIVWPF